MNLYGKKISISLNLILVGILTLIYDATIINFVESLIFNNGSIAALKFTFTKLIFFPISLHLAFFNSALIFLIVQKLKYGSINKPNKSWILKQGCLFIAILIATITVMQCRTIVYTDGRIVSNNYIEKYSPQYTGEDYSKVIFSGENVGSSSPNHASSIYFQFYMIFFIDDDTYIEFYPEEFRDNKTILALSETLADKFQILPEDGFSPNDIANMSESDYYLYSMMYADKETADDYYEDEIEQDYYAFDDYYDFH